MGWGGNPMAARWGKLYKGTPAEHSLESAVASLGVAYRTQLPGYLYGFRYFPDFFLPQLGLVIEVDDRSHSSPAKMLEDADRTDVLEARGWRVFRCTNEEALSNPHGTVRRLMAEAGVDDATLRAAANKPLADCLPKPGKAPKKNRREAKAEATKQRRNRNSNGKVSTVRRARACTPIDRTPRAGAPDQDYCRRQGSGSGGRSEGPASEGVTCAAGYDSCGVCL